MVVVGKSLLNVLTNSRDFALNLLILSQLLLLFLNFVNFLLRDFLKLRNLEFEVVEVGKWSEELIYLLEVPLKGLH